MFLWSLWRTPNEAVIAKDGRPMKTQGEKHVSRAYSHHFDAADCLLLCLLRPLWLMPVPHTCCHCYMSICIISPVMRHMEHFVVSKGFAAVS